MKLFKTLGKIDKRVYLSAASIAAAVLLAFIAISMSLCYVVAAGGEEVCTVRSRQELDTLIGTAEQTASDILGRDYSFDGVLTVSRGLRMNTALAAEGENVLLRYVDGISHLWVITVDGKTVGAQPTAEACAALLRQVQDEASAGAADAAIENDVEIREAYVRSDILTDAARIRALLSPSNETSPYALTISWTAAVSYTVSVPYETQYVDDDTLYVGETAVVTAGADGLAQVNEAVSCVNGIPGAVAETSTVVTAEPVAQVIAQGTKEGSPTDSTGTYIWPAQGTLTSYFGYRSVSVGSTYHKGIDICGSYGQDIFASDGGEVIYAGWMSGYGNFIQIQHDNGVVTCYGHLSAIGVSVGERVAQGAVIGAMGCSGTATAVHVHFEVRVNGTQVDPLDYLS